MFDLRDPARRDLEMPDATTWPQDIEAQTSASNRAATRTPDSGTTTPPIDDRQRIALRACERYLKRASEAGRDQEDWFEAERELTDPND
jgi:hypothetical protein